MKEERPEDVGRVVELEKVVEAVTPPIEDDIHTHLIAVAMGYIEHFVLDDRQAIPNLSFVKNGKAGFISTEFNDAHGDADKDVLAEVLRNLRQDCEVVVFATEAWISHLSKKQLDSGDFPMPRNSAQRKEAGVVQVFLKNRTVTLVSYINRKPTRMEPWTVVNDTANGEKLGGRFS